MLSVWRAEAQFFKPYISVVDFCCVCTSIVFIGEKKKKRPGKEWRLCGLFNFSKYSKGLTGAHKVRSVFLYWDRTAPMPLY